MDCTDRCALLRRALYRDKEFHEKYPVLKKYLAFTCMSHQVMIELLYYLDNVIRAYAKFDPATKQYYMHFARIQQALSMLEDLCHEYEELITRMGILDREVRPWKVSLPSPPDLLNVVFDAMVELRNGYLTIPMLRSYAEINFSIILENTLNHIIKKIK
jgi:hypothetical protein